MVFVQPLAIGKLRNKLRRFVNNIAPWPVRICQSLYDVKPKAQSERYAPYCAIGN
jgi:hypothetical protein